MCHLRWGRKPTRQRDNQKGFPWWECGDSAVHGPSVGHIMAFGTLISQGFRLCCVAHLGEEWQAASPLCPSASFGFHNGIQHEVLRLHGFYKLSAASRARMSSYVLRTDTGEPALTCLIKIATKRSV